MTRRKDPRAMNGGWQMDLFPVEVEPEPAVAGPARPAAAETELAPYVPQSPIGDRSPEPEVDR
ncbi:hypothetical protein ACF09J_35145 [Streptomyces sp. NPDC014889]|uniref:hypothetical protein n=1 Tax=Streptomyces sp. NPDC014889 TaxID=3364928 RepID=UPI0036FAE9E4